MFPVSDVIPSRAMPVATIGLIVVNALVFVYELQLDRRQLLDLAHTFGVVPAQFAWPAVLTSPYIHDGWLHFGGNMLWLWIFGDNVEDAMGHAVFLLFYIASTIVCALAYIGLQSSSTTPLVGASGAIAAVMGAYFTLYPRSQVLTAIVLVVYFDVIEVPAIVFLALWLLIQLLGGLTEMGAQAVGFGTGVIVGLALRRRWRWG